MRRRSYIHALTVDPSCLRFKTDQSQVMLGTDPTFLAKIRLPVGTGEFIVIPAVIPFVGQTELDLLLYTSKRLRYYLDRMSVSRAAQMQLVLPVNLVVLTYLKISYLDGCCKPLHDLPVAIPTTAENT